MKQAWNMQPSGIIENQSPIDQQIDTSICHMQQLKISYPALSNINSPEWTDIIYRAKKLDIQSKNILFNGASPGNNFLLLLNGIIRVYQSATDGREMTLYRVEPGDFCIISLSSLLQNQSFHAVAEAESNVSALSINADDFHQLMNTSGVFRQYILSTMADHLCKALQLTHDMAFNQLNIRVALLLINLFERYEKSEVKITHQELANELGTTREVVSRILKEFERQQYIKLSRGKITLTSMSALKNFTNN